MRIPRSQAISAATAATLGWALGCSLGCAGAPSADRSFYKENAGAEASPLPATLSPRRAAETGIATQERASRTPALSLQSPTDAGADRIAEAPPTAGTEEAPGAPPKAPMDSRPRITSQGYTTWIWPRPKASGTFIGYIRNGRSVALRDAALVKGEGCSGGFYAVEPRGYVCRDRTVTLSPDPRFLEATETTRPASGPFPYRYAISNGAPMYNRIPKPAEQARFERLFGPAGHWKPLIKTLSAHEDLADPTPISPVDAVPPFLTAGQSIDEERLGLVREKIPHGSMLSFTRAFEAEGRTWLLSADHTLVPADRVRPFRPSAFRGVRLDGDVKLPIAWMRKTAKPKHRLVEGGAMMRAEGEWTVRTFVRLTGASVEHGGDRYLETTERDASGAGLYIAEDDATVVEAAPKLPFGVAPGQKWIHVRITKGTLVAYEGLQPVYATLMSPGSGGVPVKGQDPVKMSTTPTGTYYVTFKDRAATMSPDEKGEERTFWIADVPHTQYFNPPFAIHAAYWHERFGEPTSAGCVNVSPIDAESLFAWSDPPVPEGWQGATGSGAAVNGPTTAIVVWR